MSEIRCGKCRDLEGNQRILDAPCDVILPIAADGIEAISAAAVREFRSSDEVLNEQLTDITLAARERQIDDVVKQLVGRGCTLTRELVERRLLES